MGKRKYTAVLVGCGNISRLWMESDAVAKRVNMVGFVDLNTSAAEERRAAYGTREAVADADFKAVLEHCQPDIVFNCTVPEAHCETTVAALRQGVHVLSEKPMADTMPHALRMCAAAEKAGRIYAVMQNRRYTAPIRALKRFLDSGALGRIHTVYSDFFIGAHFGGFRDEMEHVLLLDMAIHTFDAARLLTGANAGRVYCHEWNPPSSWYVHGASADAVFEMGEELTYGYRGSWCAEGCSTAWACDWRIIGEKGSVLWDGGDTFRCEQPSGRRTGLTCDMRERKVPLRTPKRFAAGHAGCIAAFLKALDTGTEPETVCTDNVHSLAMVHAAVRSAESGRRVKVAG